MDQVIRRVAIASASVAGGVAPVIKLRCRELVVRDGGVYRNNWNEWMKITWSNQPSTLPSFEIPSCAYAVVASVLAGTGEPQGTM